MKPWRNSTFTQCNDSNTVDTNAHPELRKRFEFQAELEHGFHQGLQKRDLCNDGHAVLLGLRQLDVCAHPHVVPEQRVCKVNRP